MLRPRDVSHAYEVPTGDVAWLRMPRGVERIRSPIDESRRDGVTPHRGLSSRWLSSSSTRAADYAGSDSNAASPLFDFLPTVVWRQQNQ
jgi:hypothetical protein